MWSKSTSASRKGILVATNHGIHKFKASLPLSTSTFIYWMKKELMNNHCVLFTWCSGISAIYLFNFRNVCLKWSHIGNILDIVSHTWIKINKLYKLALLYSVIIIYYLILSKSSKNINNANTWKAKCVHQNIFTVKFEKKTRLFVECTLRKHYRKVCIMFSSNLICAIY